MQYACATWASLLDAGVDEVLVRVRPNFPAQLAIAFSLFAKVLPGPACVYYARRLGSCVALHFWYFWASLMGMGPVPVRGSGPERSIPPT
jgi:hypothetical protein